ncbi:hypothetical protein SAMN05192552_102414 [Natrinema hispanicum]|uniref:Uncharacterized protein n=1 Tax=Natrinema hispanicum TaxID=392421 RepID=A0A1G6UZ54_9EURY|nr:hypothetical protein SAMN05192552_102414 [Natrinema hispanicum]
MFTIAAIMGVICIFNVHKQLSKSAVAVRPTDWVG